MPGITEKQENGFLRRWQRWDWLGGYWKSDEYVDETPPATIEPNFFYLNVRRKNDNDERPKLVVSDFSPILLTCLRVVVGGICLSKHPEVPLNELLLGLEALDTRTNVAQVALLKNDEDSVAQSAKALGHEGSNDGDARKYLAAAVQQLGSLLLLLKEEFKPVGERLKYAIAHGHIPRDLLEFHFLKGQKYYVSDDNGDFEAFRLMSIDFDELEETFTLNGEGTYWNGAKWVKVDRGRAVKLHKLIC